MKTKKEKILVLITAQEQSKHFITLGYDVAKETEGDLYILHIADTNDTENTNKMEQMQILAEYVCSLGGQFCFLWDFDIKNAVKKFYSKIILQKYWSNPIGRTNRTVRICICDTNSNFVRPKFDCINGKYSIKTEAFFGFYTVCI